MEKIYGLADFAAAALLLFGGVQAPALLLYACATILLVKGLMSFMPLPLYMPTIFMCGTDILAVLLLIFSGIADPIKTAVIIVMLIKAVPGLLFILFGK